MINSESVSTDNIRLQTETQRITSLLMYSRIELLVTVLVGCGIMILLWHEAEGKSIPLSWVLGWGGGMAIISLFRYFMGSKFLNELKTPQKVDIFVLEKQEKHYAIGALLAGLAWAFLALVAEEDWSEECLFLFAFLFAGLSVGAIASSIASFLNYSLFILPIFLVLIYRLADYGLQFTSIVLAIYLIAALITSWRLSKLFISRFSYQIKNETLFKEASVKSEEQASLLIQLQAADAFSRDAFENTGVAMALITKDDHFLQVNQAFCDLTVNRESNLINTSSTELTHLDTLENDEEQFGALCEGGMTNYDLRKRYICGDGSLIWVQISISAIQYDGKFKYAVLHVQNVSQEHKLTQHLTYQAQHDFLTGLPNRYAFDAKLIRVVNDAGEENRQHVLCYLDLDQFKVVNDTCGHLAGDELLRQVSKLFQSKLRKTDVFSRVGGDEFTILLFDCNLQQADVFLHALLEATREFRFNWNNHSFTIGVSIGMVSIENNGLSPIEIMKQADSACYAAKEGGRNRAHAFREDDALVNQLSGEMQWVSRLQRALEEDEFVIYHQEIMPTDSKDRRPHCELLVRLKEKDGTIIYPSTFLPAAERYNLAAKLDLWMVGEVLHTLERAKLKKKNIAGIYGVNLSGSSLGDIKFQDDVVSLIKQYKLPDAFICFEITETAAIANLDAALKFINALRELGCQIALDDFGTGLSSFAYLKQMPVDYLKIDGVFVKDCVTDRVNFSMIEAINDIGHVMGISTIAEFVGDDQTFQKLRSIGVDYAQGYWKGPPIPWVI